MNRPALIYVALLCVVLVVMMLVLCHSASFFSPEPAASKTHDNRIGLLMKLWENSSPTKKKGTGVSTIFGIAWSLLDVDLQVMETSPVQTKVELLTSTFVQYKPIRLLIHARNGKDQPQRTGGDLFHAVLKSQPGVYKEFQYQSGSVYDFDNGSYLVEFIPNWAGRTSIELTLGFPSKFRRASIINTVYGYEFSCSYSRKKKNQPDDPVRRCYFYTKPPPSNASDERQWCKISAPEYGYYVLCELPIGVSCEDSRVCRTDKHMGPMMEIAFENHQPTFLMARLNGTISRSLAEIVIQPNSNQTLLSKVSCAVFFKDHQNYNKVVGSWSGKSFNPRCSHSCDSLTHVRRCMQGSTWYFIGDSTVRQINEFLHKELNQSTGKAKVRRSYLRSQPTFYQSCNCTIQFQFHGFPIGAARRYYQNFTDKMQPFAAQTIDSIPGQDSDVLVIGSVQHFAYMPYDGFHKRMEATRDALIRLHRRAPSMTIIWRGSNARNNFDKNFFTNNAKIRFYSRVAASIMNDVPSIHIIDVWKMFFGYPSKYQHISVHYAQPAIIELLRLMTGIACPKEDCRK